MARTDEISAPSDKVIRFRLKKPFALLPNALAEIYCAIMPERLAKTDADAAGERGDGQRAVQVRRRPSGSPGQRVVYREERQVRSAQGWQAEFQCRPEGRLRRPRRVEFHSGSRDRIGRVDAGRDRLVGEPDDRPGAAAQAQQGHHAGGEGPHRRDRLSALQPPASAVRQCGDPPRRGGGDGPEGDHGGGGRRRTAPDQDRCRHLRAGHADGEHRRRRDRRAGRRTTTSSSRISLPPATRARRSSSSRPPRFRRSGPRRRSPPTR